jgi:hypothetical protein
MAKTYSKINGSLQITEPIVYTPEQLVGIKNEITQLTSDRDTMAKKFDEQIKSATEQKAASDADFNQQISDLQEIIDEAINQGVI